MTVKDCVGGGGKIFLNGCFSYSITFWKIVFQNMTGKQHSNLRPNFEDNETEINHGDIEIRRARGLEIYHLQQVSALNLSRPKFLKYGMSKDLVTRTSISCLRQKKKKKFVLYKPAYIHCTCMYVGPTFDPKPYTQSPLFCFCFVLVARKKKFCF